MSETTETPEPNRRFLYDTVLRRPGCVLLQAAYGCNYGLAQRFPTESWLLEPTPDLKVYKLEPGQLDKLVAMAEKEFGRR